MIVGQRKPIPEILELVGPYRKVLNLGCGTCVAVCLVGGEKEAGILSAEIDMARKLAGNPLEIDTVTVLRQCDMEFLSELDERVEGYEALLSMACGAGVQFLAERFPSKPVLPMVNTTFIGVNRSLGIFEERCRACSECVLGLTGGICPVTMCPKGLMNGPCGGTNQGACEVDPEQPCAWHQIWERLGAQGRLESILRIVPPRGHLNQVPRRVAQPAYVEPEAPKDDPGAPAAPGSGESPGTAGQAAR